MTWGAEYPSVFLCDSSSIQLNTHIPIPVRGRLVVADDIVALSILGYVEGDARFAFCDEEAASCSNELFKGTIKCPKKVFSFSDHTAFEYLSVPLKNTYADISIRMTDPLNPELVECVVNNLDVF